MLVLAVDTSSEVGSLAVAREGHVLEVVSLSSEWKSATLHGEIAALLERHGARTADIAGYAVAAGPGAFTGLRIGLAAVKGLAEIHGKPVAAFSTLELTALAARREVAAGRGRFAPILDARRGQVFAAVYENTSQALAPDGLRLVVPEMVGALKLFLERVDAAGCADAHLCGPQIARFSAQLAAAGRRASEAIDLPAALAGVLAEVGTARLARGEGRSAEAVDANYVRPSDAELFWKG